MVRAVIAIPTLNEAATIGAVLTHFLTDAPGVPIVVVDGGSTDATRDIVRRYGDRVTLLDNPARLQSAGVNAAARWAEARGATVLIRADAHAGYPSGFVHGLLECLAHEDADSIVVPLIAIGDTGWQGANACLQRSILGNGGAGHRRAGHSGPVAHGHHAAFRLRAFLALGGYDADLEAAEDVEFDLRVVRSGGRIHQAGRLPVSYHPRTTPQATFRQFLRNGQARARVWRKHRARPGPRQALAIAAGLGAPLSLLAGAAVPIAALPGLAYLALVLALSARAARLHPLRTAQVALLALLTHSGFALGCLRGALRTHAQPRTRTAPA